MTTKNALSTMSAVVTSVTIQALIGRPPLLGDGAGGVRRLLGGRRTRQLAGYVAVDLGDLDLESLRGGTSSTRSAAVDGSVDPQRVADLGQLRRPRR